MVRVPNGASWAGAILVGAVWAGAAAGQYTPPAGWQPSGSTPSSDPDCFQHQKDYADKWREKQQQQQDQQHSVPWWPGGGEPEAPSLEHLTTWLMVLLVGLTAIIVVWLGARVLLRPRRGPTDPRKVAMSDPWVRAQLGKSGGLPEDLWPAKEEAPR